MVRCVMPRLPLLAAALLAALLAPATASAETQWIWTAKNNVTNQQTWARTVVDLKEVPANATLLASADNHVDIWVNGQPAGHTDEWSQAAKTDVTKLLKPGRNVIAALARNDGGIAAVIARLEAGKSVLTETTAAWRVTNTQPDAKWTTAEFDDSKWAAATVVAKLGAQPWGDVFSGAKKGGSGKRGTSATVAAADSLILQPGFKAELLYTVPRDLQGSWVSLAVAPNGDLVAGDQGGVLWHVSLKDPAKPVVTKIDTKAIGCHGLLFAHGALYACTSEKGKGDIWRLRDTKGDGSYAEQTMIRSLKGAGEHGPHQLVLDRDGSILVFGGNHTKLPDDEVAGAPAKHYDEDDLFYEFPL
ncbi:hypothetical protein EBR16_06425 [bacterium]|nr:hypothetical protein [bacterium]